MPIPKDTHRSPRAVRRSAAPGLGRLIRGIALGVLGLGLLHTSSAEAAIRRVWPDGFGVYPNIQAAWNQAQSGDVIELQDGLFAGPGNTNLALNGKSVLIRSRAGSAEACRIDCDYGPIGFSGGSAPSFESIGFLRANGCDAKKSTLQFTGCAFDSCRQVALAIGGTSYQFDQCVFRHGEGLLFGDIEGTFAFHGCEFLGNLDQVASSVAMVFEDCVFTGNSTPTGSAVVDCYYLFYPQATLFHGCRFVDNLAPPVAAFDAFVDIDHCLFAGNPSPAVDFTVGFSGDVSLSIANSTIADQHDGPAIRVRRAWDVLTLNVLLNRTIVAFTQGGAALECVDLAPDNRPSLECCSIYANSGGDYTGCLEGQEGANGNVSLDPRFCSRLDRHYELQDTSPLVDAPGCGQIGAFGIGCASVAVASELAPEGRELLASPNPSRGPVRLALADPDAERLTNLRIFDAGGRLVRSIESSESAAASTVWDGRDELGHALPAGVYLLRAATTRRVITTSLLRLR